MPPFTWQIASELLFKYGPQAVIFGQKIWENIQAGRGNVEVTAKDIADLQPRTGAEIYAALGIPPPRTAAEIAAGTTAGGPLGQ